MPPGMGPLLAFMLPTGAGRRVLSCLIASGQLGPPGLIAGLELQDERRDPRSLVGAGQAKPFAERAQPPADLFESVNRGHVEVERWRRGQALPQDLGPLPGRCPPAYRHQTAASRSHTGLKIAPEAQH